MLEYKKKERRQQKKMLFIERSLEKDEREEEGEKIR